MLILPAVGLSAPARENWDNHCASCHGEMGKGRPHRMGKRGTRDYTDPKTQAEFSDTGLMKNLMLGIKANDEEERMPAYKEKLTVAEAKELITLIRTFKKSE